jgi:hypothetical protein
LKSAFQLYFESLALAPFHYLQLPEDNFNAAMFFQQDERG